MNKHIATAAIAAVAALLSGGCSRGLKEGAGLILGPKGSYVPLQPVSGGRAAAPLEHYSRFRLGPIEDRFGGKVPAELFRALPARFERRLAEAKLPTRPGGATLVVRGRIYHYESEDLFGTVLGPLEEVVARIELVDEKSGKVIGVANCVGRTREIGNKGPDKKADGLAKAIVAWIKAGYPPPE